MLVAFACIAFSGCKNSSKKDKDNSTDSIKKTDDHSNVTVIPGTYSISAPDGWIKKDTMVSGEKLTTLTSKLEGAGDNFKENVNVNTGQAPGFDLNAFVEANRTNLLKEIPGVEIVTEGETTISGMPAKWIVYSFSSSGYDLKNTAYMILKNDVGYVITCTALKTTFDKYQQDFKTCVNSFTIN